YKGAGENAFNIRKAKGGQSIVHRYVIDPKNQKEVIDIRHFVFFGQFGWFSSPLGALEEIDQWVHRYPSAFNPYDFYSNDRGGEFHDYQLKHPNQSLADQLRGYFSSRVPSTKK